MVRARSCRPRGPFRVDELDLHGLTHGAAEAAVHRFLNDHWARGWRLRFIVGRRGSMHLVVDRVVEMYGLTPRDDPHNEGVVTVDVL